MKRFHFSLHAVSVVRAYKELIARENLAKAYAVLAAGENKLTEQKENSIHLEKVIVQAQNAPMKAGAFIAYSKAYQKSRGDEIVIQRQNVHLAKEVDKKRALSVEANRQLKLITQLEDKARYAHKLAIFKSEQNELDEIAAFRAFKNIPLT